MASFLDVKKEFELSPRLSLSTNSTSTSTKSSVPPMRVEAKRQQEEGGRKRPNPNHDPNPNPACYGLPTLPVLPLQFVPAFDPYTGFPCMVPFPLGLVPHLPIQLSPTPNDPLVRRLHSWPPPDQPYSHSHQEINISDIGGGSSNSNSSSRKDSNHNITEGKRQKLQITGKGSGKLSQVPSENSISSEANEEGGGVSGGANENINVHKLDVTIRNNKVLPLVSTKGNGPCGIRTVYGYLNGCKRINGSLSIVCNCHGTLFSPAEFVRHAGGPETLHPLKHINVVMSNPSRR